MSDYIQTTNMTLTVPIVGVALGPNWADEVNASLVTIDAHDHSQGKGVQVTPAGLNINADLPIQSNNLTQVRTVRLQAPSVQPAGGSDLTCLYAFGVDLYYRDGNGNQVRITQSGGVTGATGNITNLTSPASCTFVAGTSTFVFQSAANTSANLDGASVTFRNLTANSKGLTLSPPAAMAADFTLTLPSIPVSTSVMSLNSSGVMGTITPDGTTISIAGNILSVASGGITQTQVAAGFGLIPTGGLVPFGGVSAPTGYLLCDGTSYLRATYPALFSAIGTAYGALDSTHFSVPDMRGIFPRGAVPSGLNTITGSGTASGNQATFTAHGINRTGFMVQLGSGALSGLSSSTTYFVAVVDANTLSFATSLANALAGTFISISGSNSAVLTQWEDPDSASRTVATTGGNSGSSVGSQQLGGVQAHAHALNGTSVGAGSSGGAIYSTITDFNGTNFNPVTQNAGGNETRPINLSFNFIIKT